MLRLRAFGGPALYGEHGPITGAATQRRRLALLALLASAGDRGVGRDKLLAYLWPDGDTERARHALAQLTYAIRRDVGESGISVSATVVRLNPEIVASDVSEFDDALARDDLKHAAELYAGPFLDGFYLGDSGEFDRWVEQERARHAHRAASALEALARAAGSPGEEDVAVGWWRRLAALEPLNARAALGLMQALADAGDRASALQHARVHETLLREQFDASPDPSVVALAARLRSEEHPVAETAPGARTESPAVTQPPDPAVRARPQPSSAAAHERPSRALMAAIVVISAVVAVATGAGVLRAWYASRDAAAVVAIGHIGDYTGADTTRLASALRDMLATNLARASGLHVISNARMYELLGQAGEHGTTAATAAQMARRAGATDVIDGALYRRPDGNLRFDLQRIRVSTGAVRAAYTVEGEDPYELVDRATARLAADFDVRADTLHVADVTTKSLVAYRFYGDGLRSMYQDGDLLAARRLFMAALAEDSTFAIAAYYAGVAETNMGLGPFENPHLAQAMRMADRATDRERLLIRGDWLGNWDEPSQLAVAESLAARYPAEPDGHLLLARALMRAGSLLGAVSHLRTVIAMDSLSLRGRTPRCRACEAFSGLTSTYMSADSTAAVERVSREWSRLQPNADGPWTALAVALSVSGKVREAREALRIGEQVAVTNPRAHTELRGMIAIRAADLAEVDRLSAMLSADSTSIGIARQLSLINLRYQGRLREARPIAPSVSGASVAQVRFELGHYREAAVIFDSIAAHPPYEPWQRGKVARHRAWYLTHVATALAAGRDTVRLAALADSVQAIGLQSGQGRDRVLHHHIRGLLLVARGDSGQAERELRQAIVSPTLGYTRTNLELGRLLLARRRPREAAAILAPALRGVLDASNSYVTHTELHELLARAYDAAGAADSAAAHYRWVVTMWRASDAQFRPRWEAARRRFEALDHRVAEQRR